MAGSSPLPPATNDRRGHGPHARVTAEGLDAHPHRTGHKWADLVVAGTAIFLSLLSLLIAMKHGQIMKDLVAVNSWPLVQAVTGNSEDGKPVIKMRVTNVGIGPAIVRNFHVEYRGKRYVSAEAFLEACCGTLPVADNRKG